MREADVAALSARMEAAAQRRLGRALAVFTVSTGGCGGCEREIAALEHQLAQWGLRLVTTPRHADVLLVTGPLCLNMADALRQAYAAMPEPKWVLAVGDCAADGGVFKGSYAIAGGVGGTVPVDLLLRGCPPSPAEILDGLLTLLAANAATRRKR